MLGAALAGLLPAGSAASWLLTVQTTGSNQTWTVDINAGTSPVIFVEWGDGSANNYTTTGQKTHTYATAGTYIAKLSGRFASGGNIRFGSVVGDAPRLKATSVVPYIPGLAQFSSTFYGCTGLTGSIPAGLFRYNAQVSTSGFSQTFQNCTGLTGSIPADLFRYNTLVSTSGFYLTFKSCTGLTGSIPADLFRYNTLVSTSGFSQTFQGCTGLTGAIPADLFRYNTLVSTSGFYLTFQGCTGLTGSIPTDLFRYNTLVSTSGFYITFKGCTGLTGAIPADLFRYNTLVSTSGFYETFYGCTGLTSAPSLLFAYCPLCNSFASVFQNCNALQLPSDLFSTPENKGTRFLNKTVAFDSAMNIGTFTGVQGTAPDLWAYDFGTGAATKTSCFAGHSTSSVSNYADIPANWK